MNSKRIYVTTITALTLAIFAPLTNANTAAHPHSHEYWADGIGTVHLNEKVIGEHIHDNVVVTAVGYCWDVSPLLHPGIPPSPVRDMDPEVGAGGGCFGFSTQYGDDTGSTVSVYVDETTSPLPPVWITCVDMNGDGVCTSLTDHVNVCSTGTSTSGSVSLTYPGSSCSIYEDPAAVSQNVFVTFIGAISETPSPDDPTASTALHGFITLG